MGSHDERFAGIELPEELLGAVAKRQLHFRAGRYCAREALRALAPHRSFGTLPRGRSGAPVWPDGFTGSITHTDGFASAVVAATTHAASIGIDTEEILTPARARAVSAAVAWPSEVAVGRRIGCDRLAALTLVFSLKEAIFKCLYARVGHAFDFRDVRLVNADGDARRYVARVVKTLSATVPAGMMLHGEFEIDTRWVHTGLLIPSRSHECDARLRPRGLESHAFFG